MKEKACSEGDRLTDRADRPLTDSAGASPQILSQDGPRGTRGARVSKGTPQPFAAPVDAAGSADLWQAERPQDGSHACISQHHSDVNRL